MKHRLIRSARSIFLQHLAALALREPETCSSLSGRAITLLLCAHLVGLGAFWRYYHQPVWFAAPTLALFLAFPLSVRSRRPFAIETLAPLFFLYAILIARVIAVRVLLASEPYQDEASLADPRFIFFQVEATAAAVIAYTALVQVVRLARPETRTRVLVSLAGVLTLGSLVWFAVETIGHRTRGVTATDPYAYVQMAVDLATSGSPLHTYSLFPYVVNSDLSWYPIEHIGFRLFDNLTGRVPTVWPIGGSVGLAVAFRIFGEEGLYLATPMASLAALVVMGLLAWEYSHGRGVVERAGLVAISIALLATSWEQVDRSLVPLVDTQAQLFSVLAIWMALRAGHSKKDWLWGIGAGMCLGSAYFIRHTQVLLAAPILLAAWRLPRNRRFFFLSGAGVAAIIVALPDLWYHHEHFGGWLVPESNELALFSISSLAPSVKALSERFFAGNEFGYVVPFMIYGAYRAVREDGGRFAVIAIWVLLLTGFHLLYSAVKIRDLLPEYPGVVLFTAYGMLALGRDVRRWLITRRPTGIGWKELAVALCVFAALLLPCMRTRLTILRPFQPAKVTFGYVTAEQRAALGRLAALTPQNAVVGSTMNDGPIDLYAKRPTFRPGVWTPEERVRFIEMMFTAGRRVYVLNDGGETGTALKSLAQDYTLRPVAVLDVPLFGEMVGNPGVLWEIAPAQ